MREKVLIVDDIELNREILAVALGDEYEVLQASDGLQTIEILKTDSEGITAMLLDLIMPNVDGYRSEERRVGKECRSRWSPYH